MIVWAGFACTAVTVVVATLGVAGALLFIGGAALSVVAEWAHSKHRKR